MLGYSNTGQGCLYRCWYGKDFFLGGGGGPLLINNTKDYINHQTYRVLISMCQKEYAYYTKYELGLVFSFYWDKAILRSSLKKNPLSFSNYPTLKVYEVHISEIMENTLKINDQSNVHMICKYFCNESSEFSLKFEA